MNNPSRIGFHCIILTLGIGFVSSALAQTSSPEDQRFEPTTEPVLREEAPLLPANGAWWSNNTGAGRWGITVETQDSTEFLSDTDSTQQAMITVNILSYEQDQPQQQAWYTSIQPYEFNADWRTDGYISELDLSLSRSANGTCLLCEDGERNGESVISEVPSATLRFIDALNAELTVGSVTHRLTKARFADGKANSTRSYWERPFQFQFESALIDNNTDPSSPTTNARNFNIRHFGQVTPVLVAQDQNFSGTAGWDIYRFVAEGVIIQDFLREGSGGTSFGSTAVDVDAGDFTIYANDQTREYFLSYDPNANGLLNVNSSYVDPVLKLFPNGQHVIEGRSAFNLTVPTNRGETTQFANAFMLSLPSMNQGALPAESILRFLPRF